MPHRRDVLAGLDAADAGAARVVREGVVRRVGHDDVRDHVVVDVAAERHDARRVEHDWWVDLAAIQRQLEFLRGRERVDLVAHEVAVRERDGRADRHDQDRRCEPLADLVHDHAHGRRGRAPARLRRRWRRLQRHDGTRDARARTVDDGDAQFRRSDGRRQDAQRRDGDADRCAARGTSRMASDLRVRSHFHRPDSPVPRPRPTIPFVT